MQDWATALVRTLGARELAVLGGTVGMVALAGPAAAQRAGDAETQRLVVLRLAEDARARDATGLAPLLGGLTHADPVVRRVAAEGLGRQERPEMVERLIPLLADADSGVRAAAANAVAQSLRGVPGTASGDTVGRRARTIAMDAVAERAWDERSPAVTAALVRSLARLAVDDSLVAAVAESLILRLALRIAVIPESDRLRFAEGVTLGLYSLARARRLDRFGDSRGWLQSMVGYDPRSSRDPEVAARVRRVSWLTLAAARIPAVPEVLSEWSAARRSGMRDPDPQVRRLVVAYLPNVSDSLDRREILETARRDTSFLVRLEWARLYQSLTGGRDCRALLDALADRNPHVRLAVIDALGGTCPAEDSVASRLRAIIASGPPGATNRRAGEVSWHARAHALVALARVDRTAARLYIARDAAHSVWQVRMYAARAAAITRDSQVLARLALDRIGNVREAAIQGLAATVGHDADHRYVHALDSRDDHVVLAAAKALRGTPSPTLAVPRLLEALERITAQRRETSRDVRLELLDRIGELGDARVLALLDRYLSDFDDAIAARAAAMIQRRPATTPLRSPRAIAPRPPVGLADVLVPDTLRLRVTMSPATGGGAFVLRLRPEIAPATVARVLALVRSGYYDGLTWHRVEPNFVLQGGSPAMNEYVGDGPFMRDELSLDSHLRGTLGISTRGRDTGDAQWFVNLVDNYRLDHDYTVWAVVESGMDVVDGILEGDVMEKVEIVRSGRR